MVYGAPITSYWGESKPTYKWGGHIVYIYSCNIWIYLFNVVYGSRIWGYVIIYIYTFVNGININYIVDVYPFNTYGVAVI